jgi:hypothetical protein
MKRMRPCAEGMQDALTIRRSRNSSRSTDRLSLTSGHPGMLRRRPSSQSSDSSVTRASVSSFSCDRVSFPSGHRIRASVCARSTRRRKRSRQRRLSEIACGAARSCRRRAAGAQHSCHPFRLVTKLMMILACRPNESAQNRLQQLLRLARSILPSNDCSGTLSQVEILGLCLLQNLNIGVGVFPSGQKVCISRARFEFFS